MLYKELAADVVNHCVTVGFLREIAEKNTTDITDAANIVTEKLEFMLDKHLADPDNMACIGLIANEDTREWCSDCATEGFADGYRAAFRDVMRMLAELRSK